MLIAGSTSVSVPILVRDTTSTTGAGLSGLTHLTAGLVAEYRREGQSSWTAITLASGTLGTWSSGGFVADGSLTGAYELGVPDAAFTESASVRWVAVRLRGAANMLATPLFIPLMPSTVNLADDAITASKFDESTAFPVSAAYTAPLSAAGTRTALGLASANLDTQLADLPTVAEFEARTLAAAAYFDSAADKVTPIDVDGITFASAMEVILAVLAGEATKNGSTYSYKKRDGTTAKITITVGSEKGVRTDSTIV